MTDVPGFADFYADLHDGRQPFPWQERLAHVVDTEGWPVAIGVPTGLGKTAALDIAVWALAREARAAPAERRQPTRIWYVVNRRLLVDAAHASVSRLSNILSEQVDSSSATTPVGVVAGALASMSAMGSDQGPLHVTRVHGGVTLGARVPDPTQPAIILATVPMFASRWLFQAYGASRSMRPIEAALAGVDSLILLDESHLARPLRDLVDPVAECDLGSPEHIVPERRTRPRFVELTATADEATTVFDLDADDRAHPVVVRRLGASKPTRLVSTKKTRMCSTLAEEACEFAAASEPKAVIVFTNTARLARDVFARTQAQCARRKLEYDVVLATGRMREREAQLVRDRVLSPVDGAPAGVPTTGRARGLLVVATQTLEVGADLDFDALVTETAGVRALAQRFGRLNRLGEKDDAAGVIVHAEDMTQWPVYGGEPAEVWRRLVEGATDETVALGPDTISEVLGAASDEPGRVAELLPIHLWEWAKTTTPPVGMAPMEPFVEGFDTHDRRVTIAWRAFVGDVQGLDEDLGLAVPLSSRETVDIPIDEVRDAVRGRRLDSVHRVVDGERLESVSPGDLRPGDNVVLPVAVGLYDEHGWNPDATAPVLDVSPFVSGHLVLHDDALMNLLGDDISDVAKRVRAIEEMSVDAEVGDREWRDAITEVRDLLRSIEPRPGISSSEWSALIEGLDMRVPRAPALPIVLPPVGRPRSELARVPSDRLDDRSFPAHSVELTSHLESVARLAGQIARAMGADEDIASVLEESGRLHDIGKLDRRFQRWLGPGRGPEQPPLAKSSYPKRLSESARQMSGWPRGGRHELVSALLIDSWTTEHGRLSKDDDLLIHLVASHHGNGRPLSRAVEDDAPVECTWVYRDRPVSVRADLSVDDWSQPARFRRLCERYGYWGLAMAESIVRMADHAASSAVEPLGEDG